MTATPGHHGHNHHNHHGSVTTVTHTFQAMSEYERKHWVEAMGGTWPAVNTLQRIRADSVEDNLNSVAFTFLKDCLAELESRGLADQGLYRVGGVVSKVKKLLNEGSGVLRRAAATTGDAKLSEDASALELQLDVFQDNAPSTSKGRRAIKMNKEYARDAYR